MAMFSLNMMRIALELAMENPVYEDIATKFFEHFLQIADAMRNIGGSGVGLWDDEDKFFYDVLHAPSGDVMALKVRSLVGLTPLFAVETLEPECSKKSSRFCRATEMVVRKSTGTCPIWFLVGTNRDAVNDDYCHCCAATG